MNTLKIELTEREIVALITGYYMACQVANAVAMDYDTPPMVCAPGDRDIFLGMKHKLIAILEKASNEHL